LERLQVRMVYKRRWPPKVWVQANRKPLLCMYIRSDESCIHNLAAFQLCLAGGETPIRRRQIVATSLQVPAPPSFGAKATIILSLKWAQCGLVTRFGLLLWFITSANGLYTQNTWLKSRSHALGIIFVLDLKMETPYSR